MRIPLLSLYITQQSRPVTWICPINCDLWLLDNPAHHTKPHLSISYWEASKSIFKWKVLCWHFHGRWLRSNLSIWFLLLFKFQKARNSGDQQSFLVSVSLVLQLLHLIVMWKCFLTIVSQLNAMYIIPDICSSETRENSCSEDQTESFTVQPAWFIQSHFCLSGSWFLFHCLFLQKGWNKDIKSFLLDSAFFDQWCA